MTFYVQHGYGKGSKLEDLHATASTGGAILSPADEDRATLAATASMVRSLGGTPLVDPQTYVYSTAPAGSGRKHDDHGLDFNGIHWSQSPREVERMVEAVRTANAALGTTGRMIAPTCVQSSFADVWTPLALQFARTAATEWGEDATIATLCIEDSALTKWDDVADWLDVATTLNVRGFYILVDRRKAPYPTAVWDSGRLRNLLRLIYTLSVINDYEVIWGYSDIEGTVGIAAGANGLATGWHYTLRNFSLTKWQPSTSTGGQAPVARFNLGRLFTPVRLNDEGQAIFGTNMRDRLFAPEHVARFSTQGFNNWSRLEAQVHHMQRLARQAREVEGAGDVSARCSVVSSALTRASTYFDRIVQQGVVLPGAYQARVDALAEAVDLFVAAENL